MPNTSNVRLVVLNILSKLFKMIIAKIHQNQEGQKILALCDQKLLGQKIEDSSQQLDLTTDFYKGEEKSETEIKDLIKKVYIINLVGQESLDLIKKLNLIEEEHVIRIKNVPHAQIVLIREDN